MGNSPAVLRLVKNETATGSPWTDRSTGVGTGEQIAELVLAVELWVPDPRLVVLRAGGEIDLLTAVELGDRLLDQLARREHVVLDLAAVTFFGVSAIKLLLHIHDAARAGGVGLHITGAGHRAVARPLHLTGVDKLLPLLAEPVTTVTTTLAANLRSTTPIQHRH